MNKHIVITGAAGYIGSYLADVFAHRFSGRLVLADILPLPAKDGSTLPGQVTRLVGDLTKPEEVGRIAELDPGIIINCAGLSGERQCREAGWDRSYRVNAELPKALLRACPGAFLVQASTASILDNRGAFETPYAETKWQGERGIMGSDRVLVFRFGTVCGYNPHGMRWDLPMHAMVRGAVDTGVIQVNGAALRRPWLRLVDLETTLAGVVRDVDAGLSPGYPYPVPLASANMTLLQVAEEIAGCLQPERPGVEIKVSPAAADARDYCLPVVRPVNPSDIIYNMTWDIIDNGIQVSSVQDPPTDG